MMVDAGGLGVFNDRPATATLTLTVTPDGERDRVRASVGGIVGVSFYPGAGKRRCRRTH